MENEEKDGPIEPTEDVLILDRWKLGAHSYRLVQDFRSSKDTLQGVGGDVRLEGSLDGQEWRAMRRHAFRNRSVPSPTPALLARLLYWRDVARDQTRRLTQEKVAVVDDEADRRRLDDPLSRLGRLENEIVGSGGILERLGILEDLWIDAKKIASIEGRVVELERETGLDVDEGLRHTDRLLDRLARLEGAVG